MSLIFSHHFFFLGTFTLSNLRMFCVDCVDAILPPGTVSNFSSVLVLLEFDLFTFKLNFMRIQENMYVGI